VIRHHKAKGINQHGLKTNKFHSLTTSRHINHWLWENGLNPRLVPELNQEYFNQLLE